MKFYKKCILGFGSVLFGGGSYIALRTAAKEYREAFRPYRNPNIQIPAPYRDLQLQMVTLEGPIAPMTGFYKRPLNGAAILLIHGSEGDRAQLLAEADFLIRQGFGVLSLDLPGHGNSGGPTSWGDPKQAAVQAAIDWLQRQQGTEKWTFGILGFSMGAWSSLLAARHDPRIAAVCVTGAFASYEAMIDRAAGKKAWLVSGPILLVDSIFGLHFWNIRSIDLVKSLQIPLLVIAGDQDQTVPSLMSFELFNAAQEPKDFVLIEGAGHGNYLATQPDIYRRAVLDFFGNSLTSRSKLGEIMK